MGCCGNKTHKPSFVQDAKKANEAHKPQINLVPPSHSLAENMLKAAKEQSNILAWFKDGVTGLAKCFVKEVKYNDTEIQQNRDVCRRCEYSTKKDGGLSVKSQCMGPDPQKRGAACGCFILCKTQVGECPLNKWTHLTINSKKQPE